tara:strand:+ start:11761 stop:12507 length:747 start_codon:yes stop_codon:yes gene_type:complete
MTKLSAGIIIIGNEVLSGRTQDTNSNFIAKNLIKSGIDLKEIIVIQDDEDIIIDTVRQFSQKYTYVFTTGGIGPTHDDITSESLAKAFNKKYDFHPEAYKILEDYYPDGEFNEGRKKMAKMPSEVKLIQNPITAAPGFKILNVFVLPGVPEIMQKMFLQVLEKIEKGSPKKIITLKTNLYESTISLMLSDIQKKYSKSSIGSYPYFNFATKKAGVNIVISSWTLESLDEIVIEIQNLISLKGGKSSIV